MTEEELIRYWMMKQKDLITIADQIPYRPGFLGQLGITTFKPITTTEVMVKQKADGQLALVATSERGGPIEQDMPRGGKVHTLPTFRLAKGMTLHSHELQDLLRFSEGNARQTVGNEVASRLGEIDEELSLTEEHMLMGMIQGMVMDADGATPLVDFYTEFGVAPRPALTLDWANWDISDARLFFNDLTRQAARELGGLPGNPRWIMLHGDKSYDSMVTSSAVKELYQAHAGARELESIGQAFGKFPFAGVEHWNYRGTDDQSTIKIPDDEFIMFPVGMKDLFLDVRAPGESFLEVNRKGKRRHAVQVMDPQRKFWIKNELYTYPSYICTRPQVLRKGVST